MAAIRVPPKSLLCQLLSRGVRPAPFLADDLASRLHSVKMITAMGLKLSGRICDTLIDLMAHLMTFVTHRWTPNASNAAALTLGHGLVPGWLPWQTCWTTSRRSCTVPQPCWTGWRRTGCRASCSRMGADCRSGPHSQCPAYTDCTRSKQAKWKARHGNW